MMEIRHNDRAVRYGKLVYPITINTKRSNILGYFPPFFILLVDIYPHIQTDKITIWRNTFFKLLAYLTINSPREWVASVLLKNPNASDKAFTK